MANMSNLTERQREIYDFIRQKIESRGYGPTIREIGTKFDIKSPNGVMCHLKALQKKGLINRQDRSARAIELVDYHPTERSMPLLGKVAAGPLLEAEAQSERIDFMEMLGGEDHFVLQVQGQSMIEDHIADGDFVVIRRRENPENGQRVVAAVDNQVTLKTFHRKRDHIRLEPANASMEPIIVDESTNIRILGILVGVVRKC